MNRLKPTGIRTRHILFVPLTTTLVLTGLEICRCNILQMDLKTSKSGLTMKQLDTKAKPFIDEAYATVPKAEPKAKSQKPKAKSLKLKANALQITNH